MHNNILCEVIRILENAHYHLEWDDINETVTFDARDLINEKIEEIRNELD